MHTPLLNFSEVEKPLRSILQKCFQRDLPDTRIEPGSPALQADSLPAELPGKAGL